jgi:hypothetical protein
VAEAILAANSRETILPSTRPTREALFIEVIEA